MNIESNSLLRRSNTKTSRHYRISSESSKRLVECLIAAAAFTFILMEQIIQLHHLVNFMLSRQEIIYEALNIGARKDRWCRPICKKLYDTMKKESNLTKDKAEQIWYSEANDNYWGGVNHNHYNETRYHALNLHSFFSKGTVEFRLFNSTLHAGRIKAYIQFCLAMSAWAIESNDKIVFRSVSGYSADKKVTLMYHILTNRLGLYGDEFKTCRLHMMKQLKENAASVAA